MKLLVNLSGKVLQRNNAARQVLLGTGCQRAAEDVPAPDGAEPPPQPIQTLLFLLELGKRELPLRNLVGNLLPEFAAVGDELGPFLRPGRIEKCTQFGGVGGAGGQYHQLAVARAGEFPGFFCTVAAGRDVGCGPGALADGNGTESAQFPPDRHAMPGRIRRHLHEQYKPGNLGTVGHKLYCNGCYNLAPGPGSGPEPQVRSGSPAAPNHLQGTSFRAGIQRRAFTDQE